MNKMSVPFFVSATLYCLLWSMPSSAGNTGSPQSMYWERDIEDAIMHRNSVFSALSGAPGTLDIARWDDAARRQVYGALLPDSTGEPWHLLIYGILLHVDGDERAQGYLSRALSNADNDPGTTWLLFTEFNRYRLTSLMQDALLLLEKRMFVSGAQRVPLIYGQLMHYATLAKLSGDLSVAEYLFDWAHHFNPYEFDSFIGRASLNGFRHPVNAAKHILDAITTLSSSWPSQFTFINALYRTVRILLMVFLLAVGTILCYKYFPIALHRPAHLYPESLPTPLRTLLISAIALSFMVFGIIPFLWLMLFLIWKHCSRIDRMFGSVLMLILLAAPLDSLLTSRFNHAADPQSPVRHFNRSLLEGHSDTPASSQSGRFIHKNSNLTTLSDILSTMKRQQWSRALVMLNGLPGTENDPFTGNLKGICLFCLGSIDKAITVFRQVLEVHPSNPSAQFNLARCYIASNDATNGMELLNRTAESHPTLINNFIQDNDRYFSDRWPPLRQVLFPEYPPSRLWKEVFSGPLADTSGPRYYWGVSFLGIPPLISFFIFVILSAIIVATGRTSAGNRKLRRIFTCKYCGKVLCRRCTSGILCSTCSTATRGGASSRSVEKIRERLVLMAANLSSLRKLLFNLAVPGSGFLLDSQPPRIGALSIFLASILIYTYWFGLVASCSLEWMTTGEKVTLLSIPIGYHLIFIVRYITGSARSVSSLFNRFSSEKGS